MIIEHGIGDNIVPGQAAATGMTIDDLLATAQVEANKNPLIVVSIVVGLIRWIELKKQRSRKK